MKEKRGIPRSVKAALVGLGLGVTGGTAKLIGEHDKNSTEIGDAEDKGAHIAPRANELEKGKEQEALVRTIRATDAAMKATGETETAFRGTPVEKAFAMQKTLRALMEIPDDETDGDEEVNPEADQYGKYIEIDPRKAIILYQKFAGKGLISYIPNKNIPKVILSHADAEQGSLDDEVCTVEVLPDGAMRVAYQVDVHDPRTNTTASHEETKLIPKENDVSEQERRVLKAIARCLKETYESSR